MSKNINQIIKKGNNSTSTPQDRQEMLALFHQPEFEYDLKDNLLEELEKTEATEEITPRLQKLFVRIWNTIEQKEAAARFKKRYLNAGMKIAAALVIGLLLPIFSITPSLFIIQPIPLGGQYLNWYFPTVPLFF
jgi:hypothetical protein